MKKILSVLLCAALILCIFTFNVSAQEQEDILVSREIETLENGDTIVREVYQDFVQPLSGISGHTSVTYRTGSGKEMWSLFVYGSFTYTYGVSSTATSAEAVVQIYDSSCSVVSKSAYTQDNVAIAAAKIKRDLSYTPATVSLTCDIYGKLS